MITDKKIDQSSLISQIEFYKNYNQHRKRLDCRYRSPISIKKSMSFDQQKINFDCYLKDRKDYTNQFVKKQEYNQILTKDAHMLKKILEYNQKMYGFSFRSQSPSKNLLHHNSRVSKYKNEVKIDQQNEKIHLRITKAKARSLYSQTNLRITYSNQTYNNLLIKKMSQRNCFTAKNRNKSYIKTNPDMQQQQNEQQQSKERQKIMSASQFSTPYQVKKYLLGQQQQKKSNQITYQEFKRSKAKYRIKIEQNERKVCDRIRKERLASKLYQRKLKLHNTITSRIINKI